MANLHYNFTISAPGVPKGVLCVVVSPKGLLPLKRKSFRIERINEADLRFWDKKAQRFYAGTDVSKALNPKLDALCVLCDELLDNPAITSPDDFVSALRKGAAPSSIHTLGAFLRSLIEDMRKGANNKRPSRNYQVYVTLLHKLEKEKAASYKGKALDIIDVPISEVDNKCFIQFSDFLLSLPVTQGRSSYMRLMKLFKTVHKKASDRELTNTLLRFNFADYAPVSDVEGVEKAPSLTPEQYEQFVALDVRTLPLIGTCPRCTYDLMQIYKDYCIFLYEMQMRPADVSRALLNNIEEIDGVKYLRYIPEKKKNYDATIRNKITYTRITARALQIIDRYKGLSSQGYIFPFAAHEHPCDKKNADSWNTWNSRLISQQERINTWLRKKVAPALNWDIRLTLYTFRRSTLTHACMSEGANWGAIALNAGTSIAMLQQHYVSNTINVNSIANSRFH